MCFIICMLGHITFSAIFVLIVGDLCAGGFTIGMNNSPSSATSQDGVVPDINAPKRRRV